MTQLCKAFLLGFLALVTCLTKASERVDAGDVEFSVSLGYGKIQNPVSFRDDLDTYVLPSFSYYGEKFYIENTTIGYALIEDEAFYVDLIGALNQDGLFFNDGASAVTGLATLSDFPIKDNLRPWEDPDVFRDMDRDISYLGGLSMTWLTPMFDVRLAQLHDVTGVHDGYETRLAFSQAYQHEWFSWQWDAGVTRKSAQLINYYYHVRPDEIQRPRFHRLDDAIETHAALAFSVPFDRNWALVGYARYTDLDEDIKALSPTLARTYYWTTFLGVRYAF